MLKNVAYLINLQSFVLFLSLFYGFSVLCTHNCCFGMLHVFACPGWITSVKSAVCTFLHQTIVPYFFFLFILSLILLENVWLQYLNSMLSFQINKSNKQWIYNKLFIKWQTDRLIVGPSWHNSITQLLQICQPHIHDIYLSFHHLQQVLLDWHLVTTGYLVVVKSLHVLCFWKLKGRGVRALL